MTLWASASSAACYLQLHEVVYHRANEMDASASSCSYVRGYAAISRQASVTCVRVEVVIQRRQLVKWRSKLCCALPAAAQGGESLGA